MNVLLRRNELLQAVDVWTEARQGRIKMDPALLTQVRRSKSFPFCSFTQSPSSSSSLGSIRLVQGRPG